MELIIRYPVDTTLSGMIDTLSGVAEPLQHEVPPASPSVIPREFKLESNIKLNNDTGRYEADCSYDNFTC
jgi:hypothetical protein